MLPCAKVTARARGVSMGVSYDWIHDYQLFLFDFDGLLVNTEKLHFLAYQMMCRKHGFDLEWDFPRYCRAAHYDDRGLRDQIYEEFPKLQEAYPNWDFLYQEKKNFYQNLLQEGEVQMMPGVTELLYQLAKSQIRRCVVTHSPKQQVDVIVKKNPVLNTIPRWITRGDYLKAKPDPECYLKAIQILGKEGDHVIGFEDTPRGLRALQGTLAKAVLICPNWHPALPELKEEGVLHFPNFCSLVPRKLALQRA